MQEEERQMKTYHITLNLNSESNKEWTPVVENSFSLQNVKVGNHLINAHGISFVTTDKRAPAPKTLPCHRLEGRLRVWTAGGKAQTKAQKEITEPLEHLRKYSSIGQVNVQFIKPFAAGKYLLKSLDRIIKSGIFIDWLLLKCEATNIIFSNVKNEVEIFSVNSFKDLKYFISQTTCLPLPFIYKDQALGTRYFFVNFKQTVNSKISKLNERIFFDVDTRKEILIACDLGIRLDESYMGRIKKFRIYVGKTLVNYVTQHELEIKRLIVYNHVLWGFLQDWIKRLHFDFCKNYSLETIATSLTLHKIDISEVHRLGGSPGKPNQIFFISSFTDFALYLRFTASTPGHHHFEIDNIETPIVSTTSIVQYYRQFLYINDEQKTNALACLLDYSTLNKNFLQVSDVVEFKPPVAKIKTRTVEEINKMIDTQKDLENTAEAKNEAEEEIPINEEAIIKLLKSGSIPKEKVKEYLLPFVKKSLDECFAKNPVEIMYEDETNDTSVMLLKFQEAVARADTTGSFQSFLENIYNSLQLFFTNSTSQKMMNCMIYKELENRFSDKNGQEFVGERELKEILNVERRKETEGHSPKMPKLMSVTKYLEKKRGKQVVELKPCSVVLMKVPLEKKSDENRNDLESQNYMVRFSRDLLTKKKPESEDEASSTHSGIEPVLKSRKVGGRSWDDEKLYRECLTSKTKVVLHKLEDTVGWKNTDKHVKLKKRKVSTASDSASSVTKDNLSVLQECFDEKVKLKPGSECKEDYIVPAKKPKGEPSNETLRNIVSSPPNEENLGILRDILSPKPQSAPANEEEKKTEDEPELLIIDDSDDIEIVQVKRSKTANSVKGLVKCGSCRRSFDELSDLEEHEKIAHLNEPTFKCNVCKKRFYYLHLLEFHKKMKHEKSLYCQYCEVMLEDAKRLEDHLSSRKHEEKKRNHVVVLEN